MQFNRSEKYTPGNSVSKRWIIRGTAALALVATTVLAGCQTPERQAATPDQTNVSPEEVAENTNQYIGQVVTVRSEPIEKISPNTFTIEDDQFFGSEPILVVNATGEPFVLPEDDETDVQVTGEVRNFVLADVEREYNLGLEETTYTDYENQPALIAQSITTAPEPGELTRDPEQYYGKPLAVTGEIQEIQGANSFTLDEDQLFGGQELLVLRTAPTENQPAIQKGEDVAVRGVLRPFVVADLERDYDFDWDATVQQQLEAKYSNKPILVAEDVYPSAIPDSAQ